MAIDKLTKPRATKKKVVEEIVEESLEAKKGFTFGCDPELFVVNGEGKYVSAAGLIPGTKDFPFPVKHGAVQVDGMAAEFNIDPVDNFHDFNRNIDAVLGQLLSMLPTGHTLAYVPSVVFSEDVFANAPDDAKELGCTPDFNAWTGAMNPPPNDPENPYLRTASGHLHIGWTTDADMSDIQHVLTCRDFVKQLDWYLGGWSVNHDSDPARRNLYGKAGACRFKDYGVEYRVLSNFWIKDKAMRLAVWNRMQEAILAMSKTFLPDHWGDVYNKVLCETIDTTTMHPSLETICKYPIMTLERELATTFSRRLNKIKPGFAEYVTYANTAQMEPL